MRNNRVKIQNTFRFFSLLFPYLFFSFLSPSLLSLSLSLSLSPSFYILSLLLPLSLSHYSPAYPLSPSLSHRLSHSGSRSALTLLSSYSLYLSLPATLTLTLLSLLPVYPTSLVAVLVYTSQRVVGSAVAHAIAVARGARLIRTHDVAATREALAIVAAL